MFWHEVKRRHFLQAFQTNKCKAVNVESVALVVTHGTITAHRLTLPLVVQDPYTMAMGTGEQILSLIIRWSTKWSHLSVMQLYRIIQSVAAKHTNVYILKLNILVVSMYILSLISCTVWLEFYNKIAHGTLMLNEVSTKICILLFSGGQHHPSISVHTPYSLRYVDTNIGHENKRNRNI